MKIYASRVRDIEEKEYEDIFSMLDSSRRDKIHRMKNKAERNRSIMAGLLLRYAFLGEGYITQDWKKVQIEQGKYGKPILKGYVGLHYSLSHSGDWVLCGMDSKPIGVDIQQMRPYRMELAARFYHENEYQRLCAITDEEDRCSQFYQMWAAKESYAKLTGRGIGGGIDRYVTEENYGRITDRETLVSAFMKIYHTISNHIVSVSSYQDEFTQQIMMITDNELRNME